MMGMVQYLWAGRFGDARRGSRGGLCCQRMVESGTCALRHAGRGRAEEVGFGRFLANPKVSAEEILAAPGASLGERVGGLHVLAIQDTTELNFQRHAGQVEGLGPVGNGRDRGLFAHPVIAVDGDSGALLGLVGAELWTRQAERVSKPHHQRRIEDKESYRWLSAAETAKAVLRDAAMVTVIADRESDIYEEWARLPDERFHLLSRAAQDRSLADGGRLFAASAAWPEADRFRLWLRAQPGRPAREAQVSLRFGPVRIKRPKNGTDRLAPASIKLTLVEVCEVKPPDGVRPIHWRLLTTHSVDSVEAAKRIVDWYRQRWHIEQVFRTLKSKGLNIEASQVTGAEALRNLAALALVAAVRIMQLVLARDGAGKRPASDVIDDDLIPVATALQQSLEGKTAAQKNTHPPGSLAWLAWIVARLGGWKGYKSERKPGPVTMTNGWRRFEAVAYGWALRDV